ncbi:MAG: small multidrug resistance protein [Mycobacterium sp.]|jgi:quaternary ammonium compound-resistance protein SugE|nr:small multidrug resistance protein [Mycobacterium sp.]
MAWIVLLISAVLEAVWATALGHSDGFNDVGALTVFVLALLASLGGLGWAVRHIPIGTAYAVWTGLGAALTVGYAVLTGAESASVWKLVFIGGIVASVVGLKLLPEDAATQSRTRDKRPVAADTTTGRLQ